MPVMKAIMSQFEFQPKGSVNEILLLHTDAQTSMSVDGSFVNNGIAFGQNYRS